MTELHHSTTTYKNSTILPVLAKNLDNFEREYKRLLDSGNPLLQPIFDYIREVKGKRIRPLLFYSFQSLVGAPSPQNATIPALLEMLHETSLLHDDVVDNSFTRRGRDSLNALWGNRVSVLTGDYLMARILQLIIASGLDGVMEIVSYTALRMGEGELTQQVITDEEAVDEEKYFQMVRDKTAGLFAAACELGCLAAGGTKEQQHKSSLFGEYFGISFQVRDDVLDIIGSPEQMGKPICQDLLEGKVTLPLIYSLQKAASDKKQVIMDLLLSRTEEDCRQLREFILEYGGIEQSEVKMAELSRLMLEELSAFPRSNFRDFLATLVQENNERLR